MRLKMSVIMPISSLKKIIKKFDNVIHIYSELWLYSIFTTFSSSPPLLQTFFSSQSPHYIDSPFFFSWRLSSLSFSSLLFFIQVFPGPVCSWLEDHLVSRRQHPPHCSSSFTSHSLSTFFSVISLGLGWIDIDSPFGAKHSAVMFLCFNYCLLL